MLKRVLWSSFKHFFLESIILSRKLCTVMVACRHNILKICNDSSPSTLALNWYILLYRERPSRLVDEPRDSIAAIPFAASFFSATNNARIPNYKNLLVKCICLTETANSSDYMYIISTQFQSLSLLHSTLFLLQRMFEA